MTADITRRYRWFRRQGVGGIVGQDAKTCLALARAEAWKHDQGLVAVTEDEHEPWDEDAPAPAYCVCVVLYRPCPVHGLDCKHADVLGSLGMIGVNDPDDPYLRIVAAELALEVFQP